MPFKVENHCYIGAARAARDLLLPIVKHVLKGQRIKTSLTWGRPEPALFLPVNLRYVRLITPPYVSMPKARAFPPGNYYRVVV